MCVVSELAYANAVSSQRQAATELARLDPTQQVVIPTSPLPVHRSAFTLTHPHTQEAHDPAEENQLACSVQEELILALELEPPLSPPSSATQVDEEAPVLEGAETEEEEEQEQDQEEEGRHTEGVDEVVASDRKALEVDTVKATPTGAASAAEFVGVAARVDSAAGGTERTKQAALSEADASASSHPPEKKEEVSQQQSIARPPMLVVPPLKTVSASKVSLRSACCT
jgi:hypothetical protein